MINDERLMIIHTLSIKRGVHQATQVHDCPWLLCEPNEVEGRKLLAEIMQGGNFGQYDTRDAALKRGGYGETRGVETEASDETRQQLS